MALKMLPKGPNGRALCRQCETEVPSHRRTFCGEACIHTWMMKTDTGYVRQAVERRDKGVCAACGVNTLDQKAAYAAYQQEQREADRQAAIKNGVWVTMNQTPEQRRTVYNLQQRRDHAWCAEIGVAKGDIHKSWWQADHILPVAEGGGECDLDNYQTLCLKCHKAKTAAQARRKALARRTSPLFE